MPVTSGKYSKFTHKRLFDPRLFDPRSFRVKKISPEKKLIIACPKGYWDAKRKKCKIGTKAQAILTRKNPLVSNVIAPFIPYVIIGGLVYFYKDKILKFLTGLKTEEYVEEAKFVKNAVIKHPVTTIKDLVTYPIRTLKYKSAAWHKNQTWIMAYKKGWKSKEQILSEAKTLGYPISPELAKLLKLS